MSDAIARREDSDLIKKIAEEKALKEARKAQLAAKRLEKKAARSIKKIDLNGDLGEDGPSSSEPGGVFAHHAAATAKRSVTGVLASRKTDIDVKFESFGVSLGGNPLVVDTDIEMHQGCRYGIVGENGSGKSSVLAAVANREVPLPDHVDVYWLSEEAPPSELSGVEAVVSHVKNEVERLEALQTSIIEDAGPDDERLDAIAERLGELDPTGAEPRARAILSGLGFADHLVPMDRKTKHMSGGWRMRVALAQALFAAPSLLLLDEPTNHLDLEACIWLEDHLSKYSKCLVVISHSEDFLNGVCTHMYWLVNKGLHLYGGNYAQYVKTVEEEQRVQQKLYEKQQADIEKLANFVDKNRANGVATSAKSKKKVLEKVEAAAVEKVKVREPTLRFSFPSCDRVPPPVLPFDDVSFGYPSQHEGDANPVLYENLNLGVDCDTRVALVGPNGCGKSTLLRLMSGELSPTKGTVSRHQHLVMGQYHQHSVDVLDMELSPLAFMKREFPPSVVKRTEEVWRSYLDTFGFTTRQQQSPIKLLSDGQRSRLVFAMLCMRPVNLLLLDEPTNHLDVDAVDGLARAINAYEGGVVLVSHDFRLIDKVAREIWVCESQKVRRYEGGIGDYKKQLRRKLGLK